MNDLEWQYTNTSWKGDKNEWSAGMYHPSHLTLCEAKSEVWWSWNDITHILASFFLTLIRPGDTP